MSDDVVPTTPRKKDGGSRLDVASTFRKLNLKHSFRTLTLPKKEKKTQSVVHEEEKKQTTVQSPAQQVPSSAATTTTSTPEPEQESNHFDHEPSEPEEPTSVADKNAPSRFLGEGVSFKAKLIGILEVSEARGDRMCQDALADLKMAIRAAGEHKQRISINITIDGLRLRDEKTADCLYHHPVHKISFIAQDMNDSRAFGYIFGSPDTGHRFFGIKTDKAASQVVIAMRDLFQVVFELKKQEIELAKQHMDHPTDYLEASNSNKNGVSEANQLRSLTDASSSGSVKENGSATPSGGGLGQGAIGGAGASGGKSGGGGDIVDLLDLEFELNNIQQGINQMDRITPSDPFETSTIADPFGDSFLPKTKQTTRNSVGMIPPPPSTTGRKRGANVDINSTSTTSITNSLQQSANQTSSATSEKHWFDQETESLFEEGELVMPPLNTSTTSVSAVPPLQPNIPPLLEQVVQDSSTLNTFDVFTELDPLGTGRSKPYIDRKDFFQDLKNPPKKVLKDMTASDSTAMPSIVPSSSSNAITPGTSIPSTSPTPPTFTATFPMAPLAQPDPFTDNDPFEDGFSIPSISSNPDPFDTGFADFNAFHSPLRVSLPPEPSTQITTSLEQTSTPIPPQAKPRTKTKITKQITLSAPKLPSPQPSRRFNKQITLDEGLTLCNRAAGTPSPPPLHMSLSNQQVLIDSETNSRLSGSSSEMADIAPEPPPRPLAAIKPPPLPPKRHNTAIGRPPPRPPHLGDDHYDYIENYETSSSPPSEAVKSPPLPVPARRPRGRPPITGTSPGDDGYLVPFQLLPPPQKKTPTRTDSETSDSLKTKPSLDITLSQLTISSGLEDLAAALGLSATELSTMTVVELTAALARAQSKQSNQSRYDPLRESVDEEQPMFKADFETTSASNDDQVFQEAPFDKYAVFRELIPEERKLEKEKEEIKLTKEESVSEAVFQQESESNLPSFCDKNFESEATFEDNFEQTPNSPPVPIFEANFETSFEIKPETPEPLTPPSTTISIPSLDTDRRPKTPRTPETKLETITETAAEAAAAAAEEDRYAALRDIATEEPETIGEDKDTSSEKEESVKEEYDLLSLSRQHSESTDTPPPEGPAAPSTPGQNQSIQMPSPPTVLQQIEEPTPVSRTPPTSLNTKSPCLPCARAHCKDGDDWAKFDLTPAPPQPTGGSEGGVSPWSSDGKEFRPQWPAEDRPSRRRQHPPSRRPPGGWDGDESEEPQWSDGEGGYYEERQQYRRRPWRPPRRDISPWDEEDDDYEYGRPRGRRRGWTDERRSSRESISWDEEERYEYRRPPEPLYSRRRVPPDRYYRDSRDRSWDEEYCEPEEEEENRFSRRWRPSSAGETRRKYKQRPRSRDGPVSSDEYWRRPPRPRKGMQSSQQPPPPPSHRSPFEDDFSFSFDGSSIDAHSPEDTHESRSRRRAHETDSLRRRGKSHDSIGSSMALSPEDLPRSPRGARPRGQQPSRTSPFEDNFTPTSPGPRELIPRPEDETRKPPSSSPTISLTSTTSATIPITTTTPSGRGMRGHHLLRADSSSSLRKSESVNIFSRESDPFDDDFFAEGSAGSPHPNSTTLPRPHHTSNNGGAELKWSRAFDAFNFNDDDDK